MLHWPRSALILCCLVALAGCASSSPASEPASRNDPEAQLFSPRASFDELPAPGHAVLQVGSRTLEFDHIAVCDVVDDGQGFMFRAYREDSDGYPMNLRIYRRLAGDRVMLPNQEDSVQLSTRQADGIWYHSLLRLRRAEPGGDIQLLHGSAESMPVRIRPDGKALRASGSLAHLPGAEGIVPAGPFRALAHCRD